jgi:hypothetical protein
MQIEWELVATGILAVINAMLIGAIITFTLIEWGVL